MEDGVYDSRFSQVTSLIFTEKAYTISDAVSLCLYSMYMEEDAHITVLSFPVHVHVHVHIHA